ncbi:M23 family metallopeptidase [Arthrobacter sp. UYEF3]|uniref:murein hydrolase activator EnvC family protein n=1 Tax=Arthrobacter sp. UYEF3 TaxID=1756365 RepID=UPI003399D4BD
MKVSALLAVLLLVGIPGLVPGPVPARVPLPGAVAPAPASPAAGWSWPLSPRPAVLRGFDPPDRPWLSGHRGVDLRAAYDGAPVTSPAPGRVSFAGVVVDRPVLTVDHGDGLRSSFEPVESALRPGDAVARGSVLGRALPGHCGGTPCVHWGVRRGDEYLNPLAFVMDLRPSVLLPLMGPDSRSAREAAPRP